MMNKIEINLKKILIIIALIAVIILLFFVLQNRNRKEHSNFVIIGNDKLPLEYKTKQLDLSKENMDYFVNEFIKNIKPDGLQKFSDPDGFHAGYIKTYLDTIEDLLKEATADAYVDFFRYLFLDGTLYDDIPVTENFKKKYKMSLCEYYNINTNIDLSFNYAGEIKITENKDLYILYDGVYERYDEFELNKYEFKFKLNDNGFVDDIEFVNVDHINDENGNKIIHPNSVKMDSKWYKRILTDLCYGTLYANNENTQKTPISFDEVALTDRFKSEHDTRYSIIDKELFENAAISGETIWVNFVYCYKNDKITTEGFLEWCDDCYNKRCLPIYIEKNGEYEFYDIEFSVTNDLFLDSIVITKK